MKQAIMIVGTAVLFVAAIAGVYLYQQQRIVDLDARIEMLEAELEEANASEDSSDQDKQPIQGSYTSTKGVEIVVSAPAKDSTVMSPLDVRGDIPGSWSFEGQFNVKLLDSSGTVISQQPATVSGDWMTEGMVPFSTVLIFSAPDSETGSLVLEKANPSDLPDNADSLTIPIRF